jgi:hypothetical protein
MAEVATPPVLVRPDHPDVTTTHRKPIAIAALVRTG